MTGDVILTTDLAQELQDDATRQGRVVTWTVTHRTRDYGERFVARPTVIKKPLAPFAAVLLADTLEELESMLPMGLTCLPRDPNDQAVIVEVWF